MSTPSGGHRDMPVIYSNDALKHDWWPHLFKCVSCGLTAEECARMGVRPSDVYCRARATGERT